MRRRGWFKEAADDEFIEVEDEIAEREVARANREAMIVRPLEYNDADYPRIASPNDEPERRY